MQTIYRFKDWTAAVNMRNLIDCSLRIDVGVMRHYNVEKQCYDGITGYRLTVYDQADENIIYRFLIDVGTPNTYSLSTNEAIKMLNQIGFKCEFVYEDIKISNEVRDILTNLKGLGYTHISRKIRPADIDVFSPFTQQIVNLSEITEYNYHDFWFIQDLDPVSISGILESY